MFFAEYPFWRYSLVLASLGISSESIRLTTLAFFEPEMVFPFASLSPVSVHIARE